MKIKKLYATFGCLDRAELTLADGLNILELPNEGGKSTWGAFLLAMFYGIDTSERAAKGVLPAKTKYKPWSGAAMEGRMELEWNGRAITVERTTKGRVPMGEFRAYETASGLPVRELTADRCGQTLLGVIPASDHAGEVISHQLLRLRLIRLDELSGIQHRFAALRFCRVNILLG